jgi:hypothetical protein
MDKHEKRIIKQGKVCSIIKCACGVYHIHYDYMSVKLNQEGIYQFLEILDKWERQPPEERAGKSLHVKFGAMLLEVPGHHIAEITQTIQEALMEELELPDFFNNGVQKQRRN